MSPSAQHALSARSILAVLSLTARPASAKPNALPPPVVPQCVGVNIHFTGQPRQDLDGLARGGFGWVRMDFFWSEVEKPRAFTTFRPTTHCWRG